MKYCKNCNSELNDNAIYCSHCGLTQEIEINKVNDKGGFWWGLLGFVVPLVGFILYLVFRNERPKTSKACGIGALINLCFNIFGSFILGLGFTLMFLSMFPFLFFF